jgi:hypothetical protein
MLGILIPPLGGGVDWFTAPASVLLKRAEVLMQTSIIPGSDTTYLVLDEIGHFGNVWREISEGEANETTIVQWVIEGQFSCPIKIVAFNTDDGWSRDVTQEVAARLLDFNRDGVALSPVARDFVERVTGQSATAIA